MYIEQVLEVFVNSKASDLHLSVGKMPMIRLKGNMVYIDSEDMNDCCMETIVLDELFRKVTQEDLEIFFQFYHKEKYKEWERLIRHEIFSIDSSLTFENRRFRIHIYNSSSGLVMVFRILQEEIPTIESLYLPNEVNMLTKFNKGLVLVTGATGSGKSTTLAAILNKINNEKRKTIVTVEDPIEYVYSDILCRIEQREVGLHVKSFEDATRDMMREDPDIILVGEMRDIETIKNAITLSETGHLVFATLHTKSVSESLDRIIDVFSAEQQQQVKVQLSSVLLAVLNQTLINGIDSMLPLCELMVMSSVTASMLKQNKGSSNLRDYLRSSKNGSVHLVDNVAWHIQNNRLSLDMCQEYLSNTDLEVLMSLLNNPRQVDRGVSGFNGARRF